ncbi:hypothetical protein BDF20DRAFT_912064 [Mycotypha africana]|uniref:uncharacterized protein n=1 Tax=Mycotypha africana TaxID=64632 RepID=UPI002301AD5A|nr:uncharacterized protein BDF20DRAFT_912064 [Mycotypha africana]KAI8981823.1 hypothetical protein BDF20DRAFT_912064 [Mycotypha africana]
MVGGDQTRIQMPTYNWNISSRDDQQENADEGFASSSSIEEDQLFKVIRRKRSYHNNLSAAADEQGKRTSKGRENQQTELKQQEDEDFNHPFIDWKMAPLESILWIVSFFWVFYPLHNTKIFHDQWLMGWILSIWGGIILVRITTSKGHQQRINLAQRFNTTINTTNITSTSDSSSEEFEKKKEILITSTMRQQQQQLQSMNRIFGASRASFRANADDGLLCGVLLLPMVAAAKLVDAATKKMDAYHIGNLKYDHRELILRIQLISSSSQSAYLKVRLELILFMSMLFLVLVFINDYLQPLKRVIRKRGLFVSSICVSALCTAILTSTPLAPILSEIPTYMTILSVTIFQWFLYICVVTLKKCFTLGEMCIVSQAAATVVHGAAEYICAAYYPDKAPVYLNHLDVFTNQVLIHALIVGMIFIGIVAYPLLRQSRRLAQRPYWRSNGLSFENKKIVVAVLFYFLTLIITCLIIAPICKAITGENPILWTLDYLYMSPSRMFLCLYWSLTVITTIIVWVLVLDFNLESAVPIEGKTLTSSLNKKRKLFHALAVIMFVPGVLFEKAFLQLAFGVAFSAFIYLEYLRYFAVWPWGKNLHVFLTEFIDNRDLGPVILSHIYLLLGCATPVWLGSSNVLASLSGILSLGFGDAAASIVGKKFGRYHWPGTKKTVEGTLAFIVTVLLSALMVVYTSALLNLDETTEFAASAGRSEWLTYSNVVTLTGLLEAFSTQNDNIIIPLYMYALIVIGHAGT